MHCSTVQFCIGTMIIYDTLFQRSAHRARISHWESIPQIPCLAGAVNRRKCRRLRSTIFPVLRRSADSTSPQPLMGTASHKTLWLIMARSRYALRALPSVARARERQSSHVTPRLVVDDVIFAFLHRSNGSPAQQHQTTKST